MMLLVPLVIGWLLALSTKVVRAGLHPNLDSQDGPILPSKNSARENANHIFNAIHSAGRQWGSSLNHNGFSFIPGVVPEGTLLYHGALSNKSITGLEWLAFEIEHAQVFAASRPVSRRKPPGDRPILSEGDRSGDQLPKAADHSRWELRRRHPEPGQGKPRNQRGYFHTFRATRQLELLLIDGMSAGKTDMGTLDSQDLVLRENKTKHDAPGWFDEIPRALDLCDLAKDWGVDGFVRLEIGFEIIYCDFSSGLDLISKTRTTLLQDRVGKGQLALFEWSRAVAERYDGVGKDRLRLDYSSMVSGFFFPINVSSTDPSRPELLRLGATPIDELRDIKAYLRDVVTRRRRFTVDWQSIVDLIVSRFSKRIASMMSPLVPWDYFIDEVEAVTLTWYDAPALPEDVSMLGQDETQRVVAAIQRCRQHYLMPAVSVRDEWSAEDELIHAAIDGVTGKLCQKLYAARTLLVEASVPSDAVEAARKIIKSLQDDLAWTVWKQKQACGADELLFVAMWPFGSAEDHYNPGCRKMDQLNNGPEGPGGHGSGSYWRTKFGPRRYRHDHDRMLDEPGPEPKFVNPYEEDHY